MAVAATAIAAYRSFASAQHAAKPTIAVLGFDNLSGRRDAGWLSTALSEMLGADLASSPAVRVVPPDRLAHARTDLGLPEGSQLALHALQELRRYLGVDYVVGGSYVAVGTEAEARTRLDVRVQDPWGLVLDSFSETASDSAPLDLAARIGSRLRLRLAGAAICTRSGRRATAAFEKRARSRPRTRPERSAPGGCSPGRGCARPGRTATSVSSTARSRWPRRQVRSSSRWAIARGVRSHCTSARRRGRCAAIRSHR
jgi:TolB-like protein